MPTPARNVRTTIQQYINYLIKRTPTPPDRPCPPDPSIVEILFDGELVLRWSKGNITYEAALPTDYRPKLIEIVYNGELVYSHDGETLLVSRIPL